MPGPGLSSEERAARAAAAANAAAAAPTNNTPTPSADDAFEQAIRDAMMADAIQNNAPAPPASDAFEQAIRDAMMADAIQNNGGSATPASTGAPVFGPQPNPNAARTTDTNPYANTDNWDDGDWGNLLVGNPEFWDTYTCIHRRASFCASNFRKRFL